MAAPKTWVAGETITAADLNTVSGVAGNSGLVLLTPTGTVTGGTKSGSTITINPGVSTVSVDGIFNDTYDNYRIDITGTTGSAIAVAKLTLRAGGSNNASNWIGNTYYVATGTAAALTYAALTSSSYAEAFGTTNAGKNSATFEIQSPYKAANARIQNNSIDGSYFRMCGYILANEVQYDGFSLSPNTGTWSGGTITIYGFRKS